MKKNLSYKEISLILDYLAGRLSSKPTAVDGIYNVPKPIMKELKSQHYPNKPLQKVSDHIGYFLGILRSIKVNYVQKSVGGTWLTLYDEVISDFDHLESAGLYKIKGYDHSEIYLFQKQRYKIEHVLAVLAHEYAHHYLYLKNIVKEKQWANELMTDIAAVYLGLGKLLYKGYRPIKWTSDYVYYGTQIQYKTNKIEIGYISQATIRKAILLSALRRNWKPIEVASIFPAIGTKIWMFIIYNFIKLFSKSKENKQV